MPKKAEPPPTAEEFPESRLAVIAIKRGRYAAGIDYVLKGTRNLPEEMLHCWSRPPNKHHRSFILPPLQELHIAIQKESARKTVRQKLQKALETVKDYKTVPQSQQLRAVLEMQIALGFEEDAIPVLKTTRFVASRGSIISQDPLWDARTVSKFQQRCGLFEEALVTHAKITFRNIPLMYITPFSDQTSTLQELFDIAPARSTLDLIEQIVGTLPEERAKLIQTINFARAYQRLGDFEKAESLLTLEPSQSSLWGRPVMYRQVSGWSPPPMPLERAHFRAVGYFYLLYDLLEDNARREHCAERIERLRNKYIAEIEQTEDPAKRYEQYSDIVLLLYCSGERESAMRIVHEVDSPYHAAWMLLLLFSAHEFPDGLFSWLQRSPTIMSFDELNPHRHYRYEDYTVEELIASAYNSPAHYLDIASSVKFAEETMERMEAASKRLRLVPDSDKTAMRTLLDGALAFIDGVTDAYHRANILGTVGKMEYIYFSKEDARKHLNESLALLQTVTMEPNSWVTIRELAALFLELGDRERAVASHNMILFGNDPDGNDPERAILAGNGGESLTMFAEGDIVGEHLLRRRQQGWIWQPLAEFGNPLLHWQGGMGMGRGMQ